MAPSRTLSADVSARASVTLGLGDALERDARLRAALGWIERHALMIAGLAALAALVLAEIPGHINQDAWLALVDGRYVAAHGIPQHDALAVMTHGTRWIDQQWLAQIAIYGAYSLGGMPLYGIGYVALTVIAVGGAVIAARRLGGRETQLLWVLPLAAFLYFAGSVQIRTQGFAYPLFVAVLWLLAADVRAPSRRGYVVLPLLVLWANLHGSVVIGAALASLYGLTLAVAALRSPRPRRLSARSVVFLLGPPVCLLMTPYGIDGVGYYRETLLNPVFKTLVTEWQPVTAVSLIAVPFFAGAFATVWVLGQLRGRVRAFDALALLFLIAATISAIRNIAWFGLAAIVLLPAMLSAIAPAKAAAPRRPVVNLTLAASTLVLLLASLVGVASKPDSWFAHGYDQRANRVVSALVAAHPATRVYTDGHFADWLLWKDPALAGRVSYDSRLELLTGRQLHDLSRLTQVPLPGSRDILAGYGVFVLDTRDSVVYRLLLQRSGARVIFRGHGVVVATRPGG